MIEHEIKILDVDVVVAEKLLAELGYEKRAEYSYRRFVYDTVPAKAGSWVRLRTDGTKTTLTYKESTKDAIDGMKEIEIVVDDFDTTNDLLEAAGLKAKNYQENKRSFYVGKGIEISIDSWPQIPPYLEIESSSAENVENCLKELASLVTTDTTSLPTEDVYKRYGIDLAAIKHLKF